MVACNGACRTCPGWRPADLLGRRQGRPSSTVLFRFRLRRCLPITRSHLLAAQSLGACGADASVSAKAKRDWLSANYALPLLPSVANIMQPAQVGGKCYALVSKVLCCLLFPVMLHALWGSM